MSKLGGTLATVQVYRLFDGRYQVCSFELQHSPDSAGPGVSVLRRAVESRDPVSEDEVRSWVEAGITVETRV